jgi:integrase
MASIQSKEKVSGKKTFYVVISHRGGHKWIKAGNLRGAKILKKEIESLENSKRVEKLGLSANDIRIDDFFKKYADYIRPRTAPNTVKRYLAVLNTFIIYLKMSHPNLKYLSQIKSEIIESYQQKRLESIELKVEADGEKPGNHTEKRLPLPQTVNYEVGVLRSAFIWANDREFMATVPTRKVKPLRIKPKRQARILNPEECKLFLRTARELAKEDGQMKVFYKAFKFLLNTGVRSGELCNLTWNDVDLETGLIKIQAKEGWTPKSYSREFFLNHVCIDLLKRAGDKEGYVFKSHLGNQLDTDGLRRALIKTAKAAGLEGFTRVHDLRHTFNSLMQMKGVDPATMGRILGHKDIETTMIYTHQTQEHLKKSIEKVGIG